MLNQQTFTEQEKKIRDEEMRMKKEKDTRDKEFHEQAKLKFDKQKQQDFDDLLSGKKRDSDKNLQDLFKEFYSKAKTINAKEYVNTAKSSLNSFSSILEKRRRNHQ